MSVTGRITVNQQQVLMTLLKAESFEETPNDERMDIDQLLDQLEYDVSKQAIQFTLRSLSKRGYASKGKDLVLRNRKKRVVWHLTESGKSLLTRDTSKNS